MEISNIQWVWLDIIEVQTNMVFKFDIIWYNLNRSNGPSLVDLDWLKSIVIKCQLTYTAKSCQTIMYQCFLQYGRATGQQAGLRDCQPARIGRKARLGRKFRIFDQKVRKPGRLSDFNWSGGCSPICLTIFNQIYVILYDF